MIWEIISAISMIVATFAIGYILIQAKRDDY